MFAVVQVGATQYSVREKQEILVDLLEMEEGKNFMIDKVLLYAESDDAKALIGMPHLANVRVEARVLGHERGEKIRVFKMKAKKRYQRTQGHRSELTRLKILKISVLSGSAKATASDTDSVEMEAPKKKPVAKKAPAKKAEKAE